MSDDFSHQRAQPRPCSKMSLCSSSALAAVNSPSHPPYTLGVVVTRAVCSAYWLVRLSTNTNVHVQWRLPATCTYMSSILSNSGSHLYSVSPTAALIEEIWLFDMFWHIFGDGKLSVERSFTASLINIYPKLWVGCVFGTLLSNGGRGKAIANCCTCNVSRLAESLSSAPVRDIKLEVCWEEMLAGVNWLMYDYGV